MWTEGLPTTKKAQYVCNQPSTPGANGRQGTYSIVLGFENGKDLRSEEIHTKYYDQCKCVYVCLYVQW